MLERIKTLIDAWATGLFWSLLILTAGLAAGGYAYYQLNGEYSRLKTELTKVKRDLAATEHNLSSTTASLAQEQLVNEQFAGQIGQIQGAVSTLDKLSKTDPELLRKYSEVYFLSDNYIPASLTTVDPIYVNNEKRTERILSGVWPHLKQLFEAASSSGNKLEVVSAYRSFDEQKSLKNGYTLVYGIGANKFSADQGYSEHQLGTTADLTTSALGSSFSSFGKTSAYKWMMDNAHKYGFILSYPQNNVYYQFEPWHWRFVGVALATRLHEENKYFYSYSQREINSYLVNIFD